MAKTTKKAKPAAKKPATPAKPTLVREYRTDGKPVVVVASSSSSPRERELAGIHDTLPLRAIQIMALAETRKITPAERGELRTFGIKKDGSPMTKPSPGKRAALTAAEIGSVIEFGGIPGLAKAYERHGEGIRRPLARHIATLAEGPDRDALTELAGRLFPRKAGGRPFVKKEPGYLVGKNSRVAISVDGWAEPGQRIEKEPLELEDGRTGLFLYVLAPGAVVEPQDVVPPASTVVDLGAPTSPSRDAFTSPFAASAQ